MSDYLVRAASRPVVSGIMRALRVPTPVSLRRANSPFAPDSLSHRRILVGSLDSARLDRKIANVLQSGDADVTKAADVTDDQTAVFDGVVFDATGIADVAGLTALYDLFNPVARRIASCGRIVILTDTPASMDSAAASAAAQAIEGFVRSLGKEVGKFGTTVNAVYVEPGADSRVAEPLRFLLSDYSAFIDGQALTVSADGRAPRSVPTSATLAGKTAVITGAAHGIGATTAKRLAAEGADVLAVDVPANRDALDAVTDEIGGAALALDITGAQAPAELADFCATRYGGIDVFVHNAGVTRDRSLANMSANEWHQVLAVNLQAAVAIDAEFDTRKLLRDHARVVCMSSVGGIAGSRGQTNYAATKAGLNGFVRARADAQRNRGVCYNAVAPGVIETSMTAAMPLAVREVGRRLSSLGQGGRPEDVAEAVTFLSTPGAGGLSGNVVRVCGQSLLGA
ncbi:3-oxoacyl-ACP reductase [Salinisphaera sp. USBA-960]|uniref:3-oxoacyl-ACP reductase n=1 Tax=Salinisphaera orenii TaxID=856731 RepID=UPI000DBE3806|nr:3-oxoacyl-ACP reductase [Salifodinibacter halophilus]NNC26652.1 3-oxoacyl-ACP reductase [Salifodinibacter halophilus]